MRFKQAVLFALFISTGLMARANEHNEELFSAHIEVRIGNIGDGFYRVFMDENESPFLPLENSLFYLLEMTGECDQKECQVYLPQDSARESPPFVFDLINGRCSRSDSPKQFVDLIKYQEEWVIHWQSLALCLPVETSWSIDDYQLSISRGFKSKSDLEQDIQKLKRESREKALQLEKQRQQQAISPTEQPGLSTRLSASVSYDSETQRSEHIISDTLLSTENSLSRVSIDSREEEPVVYYNISVDTNDTGGFFEVGHVLLDGGIYASPSSLEHGVHYSNRERKNEFGTLQLERTTKPNINIDVLVNGIYRNSYRSDDFGYFLVEENNVAPGDSITFRYYLAKGVWQEEEISVASLQDSFLPKGEWHTELIAKLEHERIGSTTLEYGLGDYFTLGSTFLATEDESLAAIHIRHLPTHWLALQIGWVPLLDRYPMEFDAIIGDSQSFTLELGKANKFSADAELFDALNYNYSATHFNTSLTLRREKDKYRATPKIRTKVANNLFLSLETDYNQNRQSGVREYLHRIELAQSGFSDTSWKLRGSWNNDAQLEQAHASLRNICRDCWLNVGQLFEEITSDLSASYSNEDVDLSASIEARLNTHLRMKLYGSLDDYGMELTGELGARSHFDDDVGDLLDWSKYSFAKLTGKVVDQQGNPIKGASLQVLDQYAETDENGEFVFNQVPARDRLSVHIDEGALSLNLTPKQNPILVNTREAGLTRMSVVLVSSFGADGIIEGDVNPNSYIHFKHIGKGLEYSSLIESDGFFMVEGLMEGAYIITLEQEGKKLLKQDYLTSDFWISDLRYHVEDFN